MRNSRPLSRPDFRSLGSPTGRGLESHGVDFRNQSEFNKVVNFVRWCRVVFRHCPNEVS